MLTDWKNAIQKRKMKSQAETWLWQRRKKTLKSLSVNLSHNYFSQGAPTIKLNLDLTAVS